jgi:hypothetical protein
LSRTGTFGGGGGREKERELLFIHHTWPTEQTSLLSYFKK